MRIEVKINYEVPLASISVGECFSYSRDYYLRVTSGGFLKNREAVTAVNLSSGSLCAFTIGCRVIPVNLKIVKDT